jgi:hypothetical protein
MEWIAAAPRRSGAWNRQTLRDWVHRFNGSGPEGVVAERFGVDFHPRYVGKLLNKLGFSHMSARPRHPARDERIVEAFEKTFHAR